MSIFKNILNNSVSEKSISSSVQQITFSELPILVIKHKICSAAVSLQGAHLLFWQPITESTPVIWLSKKAIFKHGKAIRGGVPICWPWFGKLGDPMHGFARIVEWTLDSCKEDENGVELVLSLTNNQQTQAFFTKSFNVWLTIHLGNTCKITLSCQGDFEVTSALHTYFGVNNIANVVVKGLGKTYEEHLAVVNKPAVEGQLTFNQEVDRIYNNANKIITISDGDRTIQLTNTGSSDVVTWNPWIDKAKSMADFADEEYQSIVCVETACINKPLKLSATKKTTYGFEIKLV